MYLKTAPGYSYLPTVIDQQTNHLFVHRCVKSQRHSHNDVTCLRPYPKHGVWDPMHITSPSVHSRVDSQTHLPRETLYQRVELNPVPESTLSLVRDFGFSLRNGKILLYRFTVYCLLFTLYRMVMHLADLTGLLTLATCAGLLAAQASSHQYLDSQYSLQEHVLYNTINASAFSLWSNK